MRYQRDGHAAETLIERGVKPPDWYHEEPDLFPFADFYLDSFWELSTERQLGMSVGPIPASKRDEYAGKKGLVGYSAELFNLVIKALDAAFMNHTVEEQEKQRQRNSNK